ncbi:MAG: dihydrodipicolinate synthase family protein [Balneolales bacterium]
MKKQDNSRGVIVPMITPFANDSQIDLNAAEHITNHLVDHGCFPFLLGTTGEAASISGIQKQRFVEKVAESIKGRTPLYVGISSTCFEESVQMAENYSSAGADYAVAHPPYFYPLSPAYLKEYYIKLADEISIPLILYNIPATTHISIPLDVVFELSGHPNIIGIKDSERDVERQKKTIVFCNDEKDFFHLTGWGALMTDALILGSNGLVPSTGNIVPGKYKELYDAAVSGDVTLANDLQIETDSVSSIYQKNRNLSNSLAAMKVLLNELGLCMKKVLPPLMQLSREDEQQILLQMRELKVQQLANIT